MVMVCQFATQDVPEEKKVSLFLRYTGFLTVELLSSSAFPSNPGTKPFADLELFSTRLDPVPNEHMVQSVFVKFIQQEGESVRKYITTVCGL
jgi:hypothetical protein